MALKDMTIAVSDSFFTAYSRLPKNQQAKVMNFVNKFRLDPTSGGINYETLKNVKDRRLKSVRCEINPLLGTVQVFCVDETALPTGPNEDATVEKPPAGLFVAATRAKKTLMVTGFGEKSPCLDFVCSVC
jgi:hypothetical protein